MKQSQWIVGAALAGTCLMTPGARGENAPPPPPSPFAAPASPAPGAGAAVPRAPAPGSQPGTTGVGTAAPARPFALPGVLTVMVFPFENSTPSGGLALGQALADALQR